MKHKAQILVFVFCVLFIKYKAQNYFNNRYDATGNFDGTNSVDTFQGKYLTIGIEGVSGSNWGLSSYLLNPDGTVYKKKTFGFAGDNLLPNKGKYIRQGNNHFYTCGIWAYYGYKTWAFMWRFNNNLDSIKFYQYGYPYKRNVVTNFIKHSDNSIYMVGYVDDTLQTNADILLIKTDTAGNEIWKKKIGVTGMDETGYCIKSSQDGSLIVSGYKNPHNNYGSAGAYILKTDTSGTVLWQQWFPSSHGATAGDFEEFANGDIFIVAGKGTGAGTVGSITVDYSKLQTIKLSSSGGLIFNKIYGKDMYDASFVGIVKNNKNNLVAIGQLVSFPSYEVSGIVYEFNNSGDSLDSREYRLLPNSQNYFRDLIQTKDKGYCFAGFVIPLSGSGDSGTQDIWLLKVDSNFCESAIPCNSNVSVNELVNDANWKIYPNPTNGDLTFVFDRDEESSLNVDIIDLTGRLLMQFDVENGRAMKTINLSELSNGIYYYIVRDKGKLIANDKFVIIK